MSVDGIWTSEIMGLFGWEPIGVIVLENGRAMGGGVHHYSVGSYQISGRDIQFNISVEFHGTPRTIFGSSDKKLTVIIEGELRDRVIEGRANRLDNPSQQVAYRLTRRADLPES